MLRENSFMAYADNKSPDQLDGDQQSSQVYIAFCFSGKHHVGG